jgi:hypothetical protein
MYVFKHKRLACSEQLSAASFLLPILDSWLFT